MCKQLPALALLVFPDAPTASLVIILMSAVLVAAATAGFKRVRVPPCAALRRADSAPGRCSGSTATPSRLSSRCACAAALRSSGRPPWVWRRRAIGEGAAPAVVADVTVRSACGSASYQAGDTAKDLASVLLIGLAVIVAVCFCWVLALHLRARKERAQVRWSPLIARAGCAEHGLNVRGS
jgi:hypothetical protein